MLTQHGVQLNHGIEANWQRRESRTKTKPEERERKKKVKKGNKTKAKPWLKVFRYNAKKWQQRLGRRGQSIKTCFEFLRNERISDEWVRELCLYCTHVCIIFKKLSNERCSCPEKSPEKKKYRELENFRFKNFECLNIRKNIYTIILYLKDKKMRKNCIYTQPD